jgi:hypothetical protein
MYEGFSVIRLGEFQYNYCMELDLGLTLRSRFILIL